MPVLPGTRLGSYDVIAALGAGGMGEVYRARDTKLGREVALKILPEAFASDPDRLMRFEREARTLAALSHPHIAGIHGLEESGGTRALVMELVEGEDLAERLARGPIPFDEAVPIARQIAEALEAAHDIGIIHRDLKPANVKLRPDGTVKVLDFGLAKAIETADGNRQTADGSRQNPDGRTQDPGLKTQDLAAVTSPALTMRGVILGTAAYMSPEQARGQPVDKRADIWAFGYVLYEMLSGIPPFEGATITDLLASVVKSEPDWSRLPPDLPAALRALVERCLAKDPRRRLRDIGDALPTLDDARDGQVAPSSTTLGGRTTPRLSRRVSAAVMGAALAAALAAGVVLGERLASRQPVTAPQAISHLDVLLPDGHELFTLSGNPIAISPDGSRLAFVAVGQGTRQVFVRSMDNPEARPLRGTDAATHAVFSPDGGALGLVSRDRTLKRLSLADELLSDIGRSTILGFNRPVWSSDNHIVYTLKSLWRIAVDGTEPAALTTLEASRREGLHVPTWVLGDGTVLFTSWSTDGQSRVEAVRASDGVRHVVVDRASGGMISPSGHLVFARNGAILAARFDPTALRTVGEAVQVMPPGVVRFNAAHPLMALAENGTLAYGSAQSGLSRLVRVSPSGVPVSITDTARHYGHPRLSPDGQRVLVEDAGESLWLHDVSRDARTPLTSGQLPGASFPIWTRDGRRVIYRRLDELWTLDADGSGEERVIPGSLNGDIPVAAAPDGDTLAVLRTSEGRGGDVYALSMSGAWPARAIVSTSGYDGGADFSPDGRWMVYASTDSGPSQIYLIPFPAGDRKWAVSTGGGTQARFSRSGRQIFYRDGTRLMAVDVDASGTGVRLSSPRALFQADFATGALVTVANYDVTPEGDFVMMQAVPSPQRINVVLNWGQSLSKLVKEP